MYKIKSLYIYYPKHSKKPVYFGILGLNFEETEKKFGHLRYLVDYLNEFFKNENKTDKGQCIVGYEIKGVSVF